MRVYSDSVAQYFYDFAYPIDSLGSHIGGILGGRAISVYFYDRLGGFRYWPSLEPYVYGQSVGAGFAWFQQVYATPELNPTRSPFWTAPYYDYASGYSMISLLVPVYVVDEFQGMMTADIVLSGTKQLLIDQRPTEHSFIIIVDLNGGIVSADDDAYTYLFCPDPLQPLCVNGTFQVYTYSSNTFSNTIGLADSRLGFASVLDRINTANISNLQTVTLRNHSHFISWSNLDDTSLPYIIVVITPTTDISEGKQFFDSLPSTQS
jgi:hypothetical protein